MDELHSSDELDSTDELDTMGELDPRVHEMLGGRTPAQFASLPQAERHAALLRHLVQPRPILVVDDIDESSRDSLLLRQFYFVGYDAASRQLVEEATRLFYAENSFRVPLYWLREFMTDRLADNMTPVPVAPLLKGAITVLVNLHGHLGDENLGEPDDQRVGLHDPESVHYRHGTDMEARWTQDRLRDLFLFTNARRVTIALAGGGVLDGSDLATHQSIKDISFVVKLLLGCLGDRLDITKVVQRYGMTKAHSLRSYWYPPDRHTRDIVRDGEDPTFEELVQVEIEEWTRVFTGRIEPGRDGRNKERLVS